MAKQHDELKKYLTVASGQKEVGLIIAEDDGQAEDFLDILKKNKFTRVDRTSELLKRMIAPGKLLFTFSDKIHKNIYDFLLQYPTGQVEIFDRTKMESQVAIPNYKNLSVVALVTKQNLLELENQGFSIRNNTGVAYQA